MQVALTRQVVWQREGQIWRRTESDQERTDHTPAARRVEPAKPGQVQPLQEVLTQVGQVQEGYNCPDSVQPRMALRRGSWSLYEVAAQTMVPKASWPAEVDP